MKTYGIDLKKVIADAKENGNEKFAELIEKQINELNYDNIQKCYDVLAQKYTSTAGEELWKIDATYLLGIFEG